VFIDATRQKNILKAMALPLSRLIIDLADALKSIDQSGRAHKHYKPGVGPFAETEITKAVVQVLQDRFPETYGAAVIRKRPDLLIPQEWQLELKILRPFGDNGKEAENWSQNLLHPYQGNVSTLGDCLKLLSSVLPEKRGIIVIGFQHEPVRIALEPCIEGFEILARHLKGILLSDRCEETRTGLMHPEHQTLRVFGWEVVGKVGEDGKPSGAHNTNNVSSKPNPNFLG